MEGLTKGLELRLPAGHAFVDHSGVERRHVRTRWWHEAPRSFRDVAIVGPGQDHQVPDHPLPRDYAGAPVEGAPVFVGHYWMTGHPGLQSPCCASPEPRAWARPDEPTCRSKRRWGQCRVLPERFTQRKFSARIVDMLNFTRGSSLHGEVRQHTNPTGMISDTAMQRLIMNSASDGAIRSLMHFDDREERAFQLVNEFFHAVAKVYGSAWYGMAPRFSRLRHGAGIVAMGFVMDHLYSLEGAAERDQFEPGLRLLAPHTAWTSGQWPLEPWDTRPWNGIQNTPSDIDLLTRYLVSSLKKALRKPRRIANG